MKTLFFSLLALCCLTNLAHAQKNKIQAQPQINQSQIQIQNHPQLQVVTQFRPDLDILDDIVVFTSNGKRVLRLYVKNIGQVKSKACTLGVTYRWRIDHEQFSNVSLEQVHDIKALNSGASDCIDLTIPDDKIHSNEGYGSTNMSIYFKADANEQNVELKEDNNQASKSVVILH